MVRFDYSSIRIVLEVIIHHESLVSNLLLRTNLTMNVSRVTNSGKADLNPRALHNQGSCSADHKTPNFALANQYPILQKRSRSGLRVLIRWPATLLQDEGQYSSHRLAPYPPSASASPSFFATVRNAKQPRRCASPWTAPEDRHSFQ